VNADEVESIKSEALKEGKKQQRKEVMQRLSAEVGLTYKEIGDAFDLSDARVTQIINS
jgi:protein-disulfide isomerase-like protein with CxxC motif